MAKQFAGFQGVITTTLDKLNDLEAWRSIAETSLGSMMQQSKETTTRVQQLEARPPPPPPPPPVPTTVVIPPPPPAPSTLLLLPPQPAPTTLVYPRTLEAARFDLNTQPSSSSSPTPSGHGQCNDHRVAVGGILGSSPGHPVTGTPPDPPDSVDSHRELDSTTIHRSIPVPKMDFPKFNGENPRWWRDQCVLYFEVYGIPPQLKTRFAALNFQGAAATWLQTVQRRGRVTD